MIAFTHFSNAEILALVVILFVVTIVVLLMRES